MTYSAKIDTGFSINYPEDTLPNLTQKRGENHKEAEAQVVVYGLDVGYLGEGGVGRGHHRRRGEEGGHGEPDSGGGRRAVDPEGNPGDHYDDGCWDVDLEK